MRAFDAEVLAYFEVPLRPHVVIQRLHADWGGSEVAVARRFWRAMQRLVLRRRVVRVDRDENEEAAVMYRRREGRC